MADDASTPKRRARKRKAADDSVARPELPRKGGLPGQRRIELAQFHFLRAVVLGMPLRAAAERLLGGVVERLARARGEAEVM